MVPREKTKTINVGGVLIGGSNNVVLQSMTTCSVSDIKTTIEQIKKLVNVGCQIVRVAILDQKDSNSLSDVIKLSPIPVVADIHYVPKFALDAINAGASKIRLNPANIKDKTLLKTIILEAKKKKVPIRIGMNTGSILEDVVLKHGSLEQAMLNLCDNYIEMFNKLSFDDIILSFKSSNALTNIKINELASAKYKYPIHLGVTESGGEKFGIIKSCVGLSPLLLKGIGDTIRVSLTTEPYKEIIVAKQILRTLGIRKSGPNLISCPTCGRMKKDITPIVKEVENYLIKTNKNITVSIMGCSVNGIGESSRSTIGIVGGNENILYYKGGKLVKTIPYDLALDEIIKDIETT